MVSVFYTQTSAISPAMKNVPHWRSSKNQQKDSGTYYEDYGVWRSSGENSTQKINE